MSSAYPGALDALKTDVDGQTDTMASVPHDALHNDANAAIKAVQSTLGVNPQGTYATVADRLADSGALPPIGSMLAMLRGQYAANGFLSGSAMTSDMGISDLSDQHKWAGGVLGPDGKIYGMPHAAADILVIDPAAGTATRTDMGATLPGGGVGNWFGGVLGPDGKIYGIPYSAADILVIGGIGTSAPFALAPYFNKY